MRDVIYLAWRYLAYHRLKTAVLIASVAMIVYLPVGLNIVVRESAEQLIARADTTPLLIGAEGSQLELVLNSLYFESEPPPPMRFAELTRVDETGLANTVPLYCRFRTRHSPIVGTSLGYFELRDLAIREGRLFEMLGECVLGAEAARMAGVGPGDSVMSTPENVIDISGVYPLKMNVVGVLAASGTPDDRAVFVDVKTAWVIQGLGHGHAALSESEESSVFQLGEDGETVTHTSVEQYNEITPANVASFHFHGDQGTFPITAVVAIPNDQRSGTILEGRYLSDGELAQTARPAAVMQELLATVLTVRRYILLALLLVGAAAVAMMILVFILSLQLRRRELETIAKIGGGRGRITSLIAAEILSVLIAGVVCAAILTLATSWFASSATRLLVQWAA